MRNKRILWGIPAIVLVFGMMLVGCGNPSGVEKPIEDPIIDYPITDPGENDIDLVSGEGANLTLIIPEDINVPYRYDDFIIEVELLQAITALYNEADSTTTITVLIKGFTIITTGKPRNN